MLSLCNQRILAGSCLLCQMLDTHLSAFQVEEEVLEEEEEEEETEEEEEEEETEEELEQEAFVSQFWLSIYYYVSAFKSGKRIEQ
jgi:hypothetical protein